MLLGCRLGVCVWAVTPGGGRWGHPGWGRGQGGSWRCSRGALPGCALRLPARMGARGAPEVRAGGLRCQKLGEPLSWGGPGPAGWFPPAEGCLFQEMAFACGSCSRRLCSAPARLRAKASREGRTRGSGVQLGGGRRPCALGGLCGVTARPALCHGGDTGGLRARDTPLALGTLPPRVPRPAARGVPLPVAHRRRTSPLPAPCLFSAACGHLPAVPRGRGSSRGCRCRETAGGGGLFSPEIPFLAR